MPNDDLTGCEHGRHDPCALLPAPGGCLLNSSHSSVCGVLVALRNASHAREMLRARWSAFTRYHVLHRTSTHTLNFLHIYIYICIGHLCTNIIYVQTFIHIRTHTHTHTYTHIHTYTHTCAHTHCLSLSVSLSHTQAAYLELNKRQLQPEAVAQVGSGEKGGSVGR